MRLRTHQQQLHDYYLKRDAAEIADRKQVTSFVWPGGGKSYLPVILFHHLKRRGFVDKVCVVVPRVNLRRQGALAFEDEPLRELLGHQLRVNEVTNEEDPSKGTDGYLTTYHAIQADVDCHHVDAFRRHRYLLVLDEVHHVARNGRSHRSLRPLHRLAAFRLLMTGSLDRREEDPVAFLEYRREEPISDLTGRLFAHMDYQYRLQDAYAEKAIIPVDFFHADGQVVYEEGGREVSLPTLFQEGDVLDRKALQVALDTEYAEQLLARCVEHWREYKDSHPRSLGMAVCRDIIHAKRIRDLLTALGVRAAIAVSDDANAQRILNRFREEGKPDFLVTVAMAYEGLDVKQLTHLVCLTDIRSFPWLMQMIGRLVRYDPRAGPWESQRGFCFVPGDRRMCLAISYIQAEQRKGIKKLVEGGAVQVAGKGLPDDLLGVPVPAITPIHGEVTTMSAGTLDGSMSLDALTTAWLQQLVTESHFGGSLIEAAKLLRASGYDLKSKAAECLAGDGSGTFSPTVTDLGEETTQRPAQTVQQRIAKLRGDLWRLSARLDAAQGLDEGTWNTRRMYGVQNGKRSKELTLEELETAWAWLCQQARGAGLLL